MAGIAVAATALACAATGSAAARPLQADVDGDGLVDTVLLHGSRLVVLTRTGIASTRLGVAQPRLDGAIRMKGVRGVLLLVRIGGGRAGITDAVYRVRGTTLQRVHVANGTRNGFVTAAGASGFVDFDCGVAPNTIVQITAEARGTVWHETVVTFQLQVRGFVPAAVDRFTLTAAAASHRRCPLVRVP